MFDDIEEELEKKAIATSESDELMIVDSEKIAHWKAKRPGKITSSKLPDLASKGKGKDWGAKAITYLYQVKNSRRTGKEKHQFFSIKNFDWGHDNEPEALSWLRNQYPGIAFYSCSDDYDDIIFKEPIKGFGDSPDFYGFRDGIIICVGEIKCPVDEGKIEMELDEKYIHDKQEYFWQDIGHLIGTPEAPEIWHLTYDAYNDSGHLLTAEKSTLQSQIDWMTERIEKADELIDLAIKGEILISNINNL